MPTNFASRTLEAWLDRHRDRFRHPPVITQRRKYGLEMRFVGVSLLLKCFVGSTGAIGIYVEYQGAVWDMLAEFDLLERRTSTGAYFCELCSEPSLFPSREALWIGHSFEPLLQWVNSELVDLRQLALFQWEGGSTYAELTSGASQLLARASDLVHSCSVVQARTCL